MSFFRCGDHACHLSPVRSSVRLSHRWTSQKWLKVGLWNFHLDICLEVIWSSVYRWFYYRAMHFSAKRGIAIACRLSVRPSVTLVDCDHRGWNSSKLISPLVSLGCSLFATRTWRVCSKGNTPKFWRKGTDPCWFERRRHLIANCSRMVTDSATVTMENL